LTAPRVRQLPTTSMVTVKALGKPAISARSVVSQPRQRMTAEQAKDPEQVARSINALQEYAAQSTRSLRGEPETGALVFQGIPVTSGTTFTLTHNFGRPFQGYRVTRTYVGAGAPVLLQDASLPAGQSLQTTIALKPNATGKIDVRVW
jgi:hypothetical protein